MVSLSTIYGVSIVLGSLAAIGSAFVGTKVYPIQTGGDPLAGATALAATVTGAFAAAEKALKPSPEPLEVETVNKEPSVVETVNEEPAETPAVEESLAPTETPAVEESLAPTETPAVEEPPAPTETPAPAPAPAEEPTNTGVGGKRKLPPWFKH